MRKFNSEQMKAIEYKEGSLMIIAGPGSGKTTVITERVRYLIESYNVNPGEILVVTFSRAAADEMRDRFMSMNVKDGENVTFGTFHSVFNKVLNVAYGRLARNYIFDDESQEQIRFDEMLKLTKELFDERPEILNAVRRKYKWVLIDEFQDIDRLQYDIIKQIAPPENSNISVVGDDDQSIYSFRGAMPEIMLNFESDYPGTNRVILNINYRSHSEITDAAERLIRNNKIRFQKDIKAFRQCGGKVRIFVSRDLRQEYGNIVQEIKRSLSNGRKKSEIAILFRNNVQPWQLKIMLRENELNEIACMTFHKSKGLEFEEVWIIDVNECLVPNRLAVKDKHIEDERRLFYVAITRAKDELNICYTRTYKQRECRQSFFIDELL